MFFFVPSNTASGYVLQVFATVPNPAKSTSNPNGINACTMYEQQLFQLQLCEGNFF